MKHTKSQSGLRRCLVAGAVLVALTPGVAWAEDGGLPVNDLVEALFNFALFVFLMYYFAKKPIVTFFRERSQRIGHDMEEAGRLREEAQALLEDYSGRLEQFDRERDEILDGYRREGERERDAIIEAANAVAIRMKQEARTAIQYEIKSARDRLTGRIVEEAVSLAHKRVQEKIDAAGHSRLVDEYITALGSVEDGARH